MFYTLAKTFSFLAEPLIGSLILAGLAIALALLRWCRTAAVCGLSGFAILAAASSTPVAHALMAPLENAHVQPSTAPHEVAGIVVHGGGMNNRVAFERGRYELTESGDRLTEAAVLARKYPRARVLISGGPAGVGIDGAGDADLAPLLLAALGIERERMILESRSRDTFENAVYSLPWPSPLEVKRGC